LGRKWKKKLRNHQWNGTHHLLSVQRAEGGLLAGADGTDGQAGGGQVTGLGDGHAGGENDELIF
jgi:hypothetical protein